MLLAGGFRTLGQEIVVELWFVVQIIFFLNYTLRKHSLLHICKHHPTGGLAELLAVLLAFPIPNRR